jgi:iron(III) transport system substrate-binding protein
VNTQRLARNWTTVALTIFVAALSVLLAACSASPAPGGPATSSAAPTVSSAPAPVPTMQADPTRWAQVIEAAKKEGHVVVQGAPDPALRQALVDAFQKRYGIAMDYLTLPTTESYTRIQREVQAGKSSIDAYFGGRCWVLGEAKAAENIVPLIIDPAVLNPASWKDGAPRLMKPSAKMAKGEYCGVQTNETLYLDLLVNTDLAPSGTVKTWKDLLKPEFKGKIIAFDPRVAGAGQGTLAYLSYLFGQQFVSDLYRGQSVRLSTDYNDLASSVARGAYAIGLSATATFVEPLRTAGLPIEVVHATDGPGLVSGGFSVIAQIKNATNPNAATVFVNWFLSQEAQQIYSDTQQTASLRADVEPRRVPSYLVPERGSKPVDFFDADFNDTYSIPAQSKIGAILGD